MLINAHYVWWLLFPCFYDGIARALWLHWTCPVTSQDFSWSLCAQYPLTCKESALMVSPPMVIKALSYLHLLYTHLVFLQWHCSASLTQAPTMLFWTLYACLLILQRRHHIWTTAIPCHVMNIFMAATSSIFMANPSFHGMANTIMVFSWQCYWLAAPWNFFHGICTISWYGSTMKFESTALPWTMIKPWNCHDASFMDYFMGSMGIS